MKKIFGLIAVLVLAGVGFMSYKYWDSTYNGKEAYAVVNAPVKKESTTDKGTPYKKDGQQYYYYEYSFDFVTTKGDKIQMSWSSPEGPDPKPMADGTIVKGKVSQKRVVEGPNPVEKSEVPADVLAKLQ